MFKKIIFLVFLFLCTPLDSSSNLMDSPLTIPPRSVQLELQPPAGFEALRVSIIFSEQSTFRLASLVLDTGVNSHELDLRDLNIYWPIDLNEFGPFLQGFKSTYDYAHLYLYYGPGTRVECGKDRFELAREAKKIIVYPEEPPSIETSYIHFEVCEQATQLERELAD